MVELLKTAVRLRARGFPDAIEMTPGQAIFAWLTLLEDDRDRRIGSLDDSAVAVRWGFGSDPKEFDKFRRDLRA